MAEQAFAPERSAPEVDQFRTPRPNAPQAISTTFTARRSPTPARFRRTRWALPGRRSSWCSSPAACGTFNKTTGIADAVLNVDPKVFFNAVMTVPPGGGINFTIYPQVRYDRLTARWILTIVDIPSSTPADIGDIPNRVLIAVSDAASAGLITGAHRLDLLFVQQDTVGGGPSTGEFLDYPSLGIDANALYIGGNIFVRSRPRVPRARRPSWSGKLDPERRPDRRHRVPRHRAEHLSDGPFSPRGVDNYDPAATEGYFIGVSNRRLQPVDPAASQRSRRHARDLRRHSHDRPGHEFPITVHHLGNTGGTNGNLNALDDRLFAAHIRNGRLWTAHNIAVDAAGVASLRRPAS